MSEFQGHSILTEDVEDFDDEIADDGTACDINKLLAGSTMNRGNFMFGRTLGEGSYARVMHTKLKSESSRHFATKIMEKSFIKKEKKIKYVAREIEILSAISHPLIIKLVYTFQDPSYLYLCMEMADGGELLKIIKQCTAFNARHGRMEAACPMPVARFYAAELILALEYLHNLNIVHMDIKPENILITSAGHVKIADFGTAMKDIAVEAMSDIFVGTAEYVSPEILNEDGIISKACDLWALGCIIYQMLCGLMPFHADTEYLIFVAINGHLDGTQPIRYPDSISHGASRDIIEGLLRKSPMQRLGSGAIGSGFGYDSLKQHPFFEGIDFDNIIGSVPPSNDALAGAAAFGVASSITSSVSEEEIMHDGALDTWLLEGEATQIQTEKRANAKPGGISSEASTLTKWARFLTLPGEKELLNGSVLKRVGLFSKRRQLILTDAPRLIYVDPDSMEQKGEIPWTAEFPVNIRPVSSTIFDAVCTSTGRSYHFKDCSGMGSGVWADKVNNVLNIQRRRSSAIGK